MFKAAKHKAILLQAVSDCFEPLRSDLGNVHPDMRQSPFISGAILGICRGYVDQYRLKETLFNSLVDNVFEEVFRSQSLSMQTKAEQWLNEAQTDFMNAYYQGKEKTTKSLKLDWLSQYAQMHFKKASTLQQPL